MAVAKRYMEGSEFEGFRENCKYSRLLWYQRDATSLLGIPPELIKRSRRKSLQVVVLRRARAGGCFEERGCPSSAQCGDGLGKNGPRAKTIWTLHRWKLNCACLAIESPASKM